MPPEQFATLATVQAAVLDLMGGTEPVIWAIAIRIWQSVATVRICWLGLEIALGKRQAMVAEVVELVLLLSFVYSLVVFYAAPIPGIGIAASELIPSMAQFLANLFDARALEETFYHLDVLASTLVAPSILSVAENAFYYAVLLLLAFCKAVMLLLLLGPLIGEALLVCVGALFLPFLIIPKLEFVAFGWIRALLTCSFTKVFGFAYLLLFSRFLGRMVLTMPAQIAGTQLPLYAGMLIGLIAAFMLGAIIVVPRLAGLVFGAEAPVFAVGKW